jgi:hypothetical protein
MNPQTPPLPFKDRKAWLIVFGILTVGLGILCGLFVLLMLAAMTTSGREANAAATVGVLPGIAIYGGLAMGLIWLGIGSMLCCRWARALILIFSWVWLLIGVMVVIFSALVLPRTIAASMAQTQDRAPIPENAAAIATGIALFILNFLFIVLPTIWVLFYGSKHVKATCEARDPVIRWTDRCPLPVLAGSLMFAFCAATMLIMPFTFRSVLPFFGTFLVGLPATVCYLILAGLWAYAAWSIYKLRWSGWWAAFLSLAVLFASNVATYSLRDVSEMYVLMGFSEQQIVEMQPYILKGGMAAWIMVLAGLPWLAYLVFILRYFRRRVPERRAEV